MPLPCLKLSANSIPYNDLPSAYAVPAISSTRGSTPPKFPARAHRAGWLTRFQTRSEPFEGLIAPGRRADNFYGRRSIPRTANAAWGKSRAWRSLKAASPSYPGRLLRRRAPGKTPIYIAMSRRILLSALGGRRALRPGAEDSRLHRRRTGSGPQAEPVASQGAVPRRKETRSL